MSPMLRDRPDVPEDLEPFQDAWEWLSLRRPRTGFGDCLPITTCEMVAWMNEIGIEDRTERLEFMAVMDLLDRSFFADEQEERDRKASTKDGN